MSRSGLIRMKGAPVTFTHVELADRNRTAGTSGAPTRATIKGYAMRSTGDVQTYRALELKETEAITIDFVPKTAGECPEQDYLFEWGSPTAVKYKVVSVEKIDQNGTVSGARIIGSR